MFARIKDKCSFFYRSSENNSKKNDDIINSYEDTNDEDTKSQELQFLLERCDLDSETSSQSSITNTAKNILDKFSLFIKKIKPTLVSAMSKSYFITSCIGIYAKYYILYKCSKKTTDDYNSIVMRISGELADKNIFFTKIFQGIANNANNKLMNKDLFNYFINYTDNVKYDESEIDYRGLYNLISIAKNKGDELIIHCGEKGEPIKSGVVAIAYKASLNGKQVIIKYRRKNISEKFDKSMKELELLVNMTKKMPYFCNLNICDIFEENREIMLGQLDFANEVENIQDFYNKFKDVKDVCIPYVYSYFTEENPNAIIMDYIEGIRLENICECDKDLYSKILSRFNIKSVFYDSLYHADLHSGNIIFMKEKDHQGINDILKIGVIDYGIIGKLTREEQNIFFNFFKILVSGNYEKLAKYIVTHLSEPLEKEEKGEKREKHDKSNENRESIASASASANEKLITDIYNICYHTLSIKQIFFGGEEIYEVNKILKTENLTFCKFFCRIELAIAISENVCNALCKDKTYIEQLVSAFKDLFKGSYDTIFDDEGEGDDEDEV
jgi:tRNA A-37 threonylcarbamoyl transferase component Bud32